MPNPSIFRGPWKDRRPPLSEADKGLLVPLFMFTVGCALLGAEAFGFLGFLGGALASFGAACLAMAALDDISAALRGEDRK